MELQYDNPVDKYAKVTFFEYTIMVGTNDILGDTLKAVSNHCKTRFSEREEGRAALIYYLRGRINFADYSEVLIGFQMVSHLPKQLFEIVHCLPFWNQEGRKMYQLYGQPGESYAQFILRCIAADCRTFVKPFPAMFKTGQGEDVVWVSTANDNRILTIKF